MELSEGLSVQDRCKFFETPRIQITHTVNVCTHRRKAKYKSKQTINKCHFPKKSVFEPAVGDIKTIFMHLLCEPGCEQQVWIRLLRPTLLNIWSKCRRVSEKTKMTPYSSSCVLGASRSPEVPKSKRHYFHPFLKPNFTSNGVCGNAFSSAATVKISA